MCCARLKVAKWLLSGVLRGARLSCMGLDFRPLHSIYRADCFDLLLLLIERYQAYPERKAMRHHIII
jgi:hypothetical protein